MTWILNEIFKPKESLSKPIAKALIAFNTQQIGDHTPDTLLITANSPEGIFLGGIEGCLQFGWLYVDMIWVEETARRKGLGTELLNALEAMAQKRGIKRAWLRTGSFQSGRALYERAGYTVFAERPLAIGQETTDTHWDYFMEKYFLS